VIFLAKKNGKTEIVHKKTIPDNEDIQKDDNTLEKNSIKEDTSQDHASIEAEIDTKDEEISFSESERDYPGGLTSITGACLLLISAVYLSISDKGNALLWFVILSAFSVPLFMAGVYFLSITSVSVDMKKVTRKIRMGKRDTVPWKRIQGITLEQGVPNDLSVQRIVFWAENGEYIQFISTDEISYKMLARVAGKFKRITLAKGITYEDRTVLLK
jgi:hypothetical protein